MFDFFESDLKLVTPKCVHEGQECYVAVEEMSETDSNGTYTFDRVYFLDENKRKSRSSRAWR
jgi:hypothetical protein